MQKTYQEAAEKLSSEDMMFQTDLKIKLIYEWVKTDVISCATFARLLKLNAFLCTIDKMTNSEMIGYCHHLDINLDRQRQSMRQLLITAEKF